MARRRIFISHSAHRDPSARPVLDALEAKLVAMDRDYSVLLDHSTLKPGEDWRSAINVWCGACDAAILLVTQDSMRAEFCNYEWSVLSYRKARSQNFNILPVYYGATPEDLRGKPHQLSEIQGVTFSTIENSWPAIETWLGEVVSHDGPAATQASVLGSLFRVAIPVPDDNQLQRALSKIDLELSPWDPLEDRLAQFALLLIGLGLPKAAPVLGELAWHFAGNKDRWNDILDLVACSWVDDRAAQRLAERTGGQCQERAVALNAEEGKTARLYVVKASGRPPSATWCIAAANDVAADLEDLKSQIEVSLAQALRLETAPVDRALLDKRLKNKEKTKQPVVVYLSARGLDQVWLAKLRERFECVTFFLLCGADRPAFSGVEWIEPELEPNFEGTFWKEYEDSKDGLDAG